jgi:hypothetical protein
MTDRPRCIPQDLYPFDDHYADVDGATTHHVDEGNGPPLLLLRGHPTWSFSTTRLTTAATQIPTLSADEREDRQEELKLKMPEIMAGESVQCAEVMRAIAKREPLAGRRGGQHARARGRSGCGAERAGWRAARADRRPPPLSRPPMRWPSSLACATAAC